MDDQNVDIQILSNTPLLFQYHRFDLVNFLIMPIFYYQISNQKIYINIFNFLSIFRPVDQALEVAKYFNDLVLEWCHESKSISTLETTSIPLPHQNNTKSDGERSDGGRSSVIELKSNQRMYGLCQVPLQDIGFKILDHFISKYSPFFICKNISSQMELVWKLKDLVFQLHQI